MLRTDLSGYAATRFIYSLLSSLSRPICKTRLSFFSLVILGIHSLLRLSDIRQLIQIKKIVMSVNFHNYEIKVGVILELPYHVGKLTVLWLNPALPNFHTGKGNISLLQVQFYKCLRVH